MPHSYSNREIKQIEAIQQAYCNHISKELPPELLVKEEKRFTFIPFLTVTQAQHEPSSQNFDNVRWMQQLPQTSLHRYADQICQLSCQYWSKRQERWIGKGDLGDPYSLFISEFNRWMTVASAKVINEDLINEINQRIQYLRELESHEILAPGHFSPMTFRYTIFQIRRVLDQTCSYCEVNLLNRSAQQDLEQLKENTLTLLIQGVQCLFTIFNNQRITNVNISLESFKNPSQHDKEIQQHYQTHFGKNLKLLIDSVFLDQVIQDQRDPMSIEPQFFYNNKFITFEPLKNQIKINDSLFSQPKTNDLGILPDFNTQNDCLKQFLILHGLLESVGQFYQLTKLLEELGRDGGNLMIYGAMNTSVRSACEKFQTLLDKLQQAIQILNESVEQYRGNILIRNKANSWNDNYPTISSIIKTILKQLTICRTTVSNIFTNASQGISREDIEIIKTRMICFNSYMLNFGAQIQGQAVPVVATLVQSEERRSPLKLLEVCEDKKIPNDSQNLAELIQIIFDETSHEQLIAWMNDDENKDFPKNAFEEQWLKDWQNDCFKLKWQPIYSIFVKKYCLPDVLQAYNRHWLACVLSTKESAKELLDKNEHLVTTDTLRQFYGDIADVVDIVEQMCLRFVDDFANDHSNISFNRDGFELINTYLCACSDLFEPYPTEKIQSIINLYLLSTSNFNTQARNLLLQLQQEQNETINEEYTKLVNLISQCSNDEPAQVLVRRYQTWVDCLIELSQQKDMQYDFKTLKNNIHTLPTNTMPTKFLELLQAVSTKIKFENPAISLLLIKWGINVQQLDDRGYSFLDQLALSGQLNILRYLIADLNSPYQFLVSKDNSNLLHSAALGGDCSTCIYLIDKGVSIHQPNAKLLTPLHIASMQGNIGVIKELIMRGANVNALDENRQTPLHWAVRRRQTEAVRYLLEKGADPDCLDRSFDNNKKGIIKIFDKKPNRGRSPRDYADAITDIKLLFMSYPQLQS